MIKKFLKSTFVLMYFVTFFCNQAQAQVKINEKSGEKKQSLSFEDELVEGATQKPELFYLFQKRNFNYNRLIKLRENFLPEMRRTSEDVSKVRSGN